MKFASSTILCLYFFAHSQLNFDFGIIWNKFLLLLNLNILPTSGLG